MAIHEITRKAILGISKNTNSRKIVAIFSCALVFLFAFALFGVYTAEAISISPLTYEINVDPGQMVDATVTVFNNGGSSDVTIMMTADDFVPVGESGGVIIEPLPPEISAKGWLEFSPASFVLKPGASQEVRYTLKVPQNAEPGGHYAAIIAGTGLPDTSGTTGTTLAQKLASLLLIKVSGTIHEEMALKEFTVPQFSEYAPIKFSARFENTGSVHMKPAGYITIKNMFGSEAAKIDLPQLRVLPHTVRLMEASWDAPKWAVGKFRAELTAIYGSQNEPLAAAVEFWIIPWKLFGGIVAGGFVFLILLWLMRRRLMLALKILFKGEHAS